tara:strand:- start:31 stop:261 length:231 start_codon:yes stop_codon:yes gene_type:complete
MGRQLSKERSVKLVVDGMDELDVRLDDLESKFVDMLAVIAALSAEVISLKGNDPAKFKTKDVSKKDPVKKASIKKK